MNKKTPWNKGLTKDTSPILARIAKRQSEIWKNTDTSARRIKIGLASKGRIKGMDKHPAWKGGKYKDKRDGYIFIYQPKNPNARSDGYVLEHRLIMSDFLGRPIAKDEDINHLNGKKDDNRLENLRLVRHYAHYEELECPKCKFKFLTR